MSGIQSAASDRFHARKPTRHGSVLSSGTSADKKQKFERSVSSTHDISSSDYDSTEGSSRKTTSAWDESRHETYGLVQRCVIIQRDENGFGLTVSGDNPVFVQSVKEDGAAMRAGVQTGDRIIKVNGTLVTHSNHLEVVKLIKSGSYVALTVQGRPPGSSNHPISDGDPFSPAPIPSNSPVNHGYLERITSPILMGEDNNAVHSQKLDILKKMLQQEKEQLQSSQEEYNCSPSARLYKEIQDTKKHIYQLQKQLFKTRPPTQIGELDADSFDQEHYNCIIGDGSQPNIVDSPGSGQRGKIFLEESPEKIECQDTDSHSSMGSPSTPISHSIIGAEDEDFDPEPYQVNDHCSCFQNIDLLKSHPAHLAVFMFHVVSQFDPSPLLCYLYCDLYQQTNSKETRRIFLEIYHVFLEKNANLRVSLPEDLALELEKRRPELIPEDLLRQYVNSIQEKMLPDVQKLLEDFRQKRNMGLTLAESELTKLDAKRAREPQTIEKERICAEPILQKIDDILMSSQPSEEEKSGSIQYVIWTYMKHLGVKVREPRILDQRRCRIGFLPKIKQSIKKDKEGEEKWKRRGFPSILVPPRRTSRQDSTAICRALQMQKPKQFSQPTSSSPEPAESRLRFSGGSTDGPDNSLNPFSPPPNTGIAYNSPDGSREQDGVSKFAAESVYSMDSCDGSSRTSGSLFDFPLTPLDLSQEENKETDRFSELGTPKPNRKLDVPGFSEAQSEEELHDLDLEMDPPNWQQLVSRDILQHLQPHEIKRQEVIHELFYTERTHVRKLNVLNQVFHQRVKRESLLTPTETSSVFSNIEEILELHVGLKEKMKDVRKRYETSVVEQIGDDVLSWFCGPEEEILKQAVATFCSNQPFALEMIKSRQKKDPKFLMFVQDAESNPLCRRLQLKDIIPTEMQRLTKYPLLLDNIAKYSDQPEEKKKVKKAADHCRGILHHVNQAVLEAENKQRLEDYQRRLDFSYLKPGEYPMIDELRNLDLTKRKMFHEGLLAWKVNRDKIIDLYALLLEDILVLLQKQDDKLILRCHSKILATTSDSKHVFSPVIKLSTVLVRQVATDNKALFVISMSENGAQIYELIANSVSEKNVWQDLITRMAASCKEGDHRSAIPIAPSGITNERIQEANPRRLIPEKWQIRRRMFALSLCLIRWKMLPLIFLMRTRIHLTTRRLPILGGGGPVLPCPRTKLPKVYLNPLLQDLNHIRRNYLKDMIMEEWKDPYKKMFKSRGLKCRYPFAEEDSEFWGKCPKLDSSFAKVSKGAGLAFENFGVLCDPLDKQMDSLLKKAWQVESNVLRLILASNCVIRNLDFWLQQLKDLKKASGGFRFILNLKKLNFYVQYKHFRMETIFADLKDAYWHVPMSAQAQSFMRFAIKDGDRILHFQFVCLPFGLASAPRIFTKVLAEPLAYLMRRGIGVVTYLDDLLLFAQSRNRLLENLSYTLNLLARLGWILNHEKSSLVASQVMTYLGFETNSVHQILILPQQKMLILQEAVCFFLRKHGVLHKTGHESTGAIDFSIYGNEYRLRAFFMDAKIPPLSDAHSQEVDEDITVEEILKAIKTLKVDSETILQPLQGNAHQQGIASSSSHTSGSTPLEHTWALDALRNLELLKQLLIQQVKLLQKEEVENFKRFCSRSSQDQAANSDCKLKTVGIHQQRKKSRESCSSRQSSLQQTEGRYSDGRLNSDLTDECTDESGEQFLDAQELQGDSNESSIERDLDGIQYRISGKYLILDGYESVQESSTDEDYICPEPATYCTFSDQKAHSSSSPVAERLSSPASELPGSTAPSDTFGQMLHYITKIETDLQQLKGLENYYHALQNKLAASGLLDEDPDISMLPTDKG
ncbi:rho guanine nucleotide exchange factor 12 [Gastrophryne carolinensis]